MKTLFSIALTMILSVSAYATCKEPAQCKDQASCEALSKPGMQFTFVNNRCMLVDDKQKVTDCAGINNTSGQKVLPTDSADKKAPVPGGARQK